MIHIDRPRDIPTALQSDKVRTTLDRLGTLNPRKSSDFEPHWNTDEVRSALWEMQRHKCSYCERTRELKYETDVEHFRPKAGVTECNGENGYWWLAYEWTNLFFSCRICNQKYKKNHFPIAAESARACKPEDALDCEKYLLIDPSREDPEEYLSWDWIRRIGSIRYVFICWREDRGRATVETLGLNHGELARERGRIVSLLLQLIFDYKRMVDKGVSRANEAFQLRKRILLDELVPDRPFLALRRFIVRSHDLGDLIDEADRLSVRGLKSATSMPAAK
jgi:uncharacterized protein (TIGR02646 family)